MIEFRGRLKIEKVSPKGSFTAEGTPRFPFDAFVRSAINTGVLGIYIYLH